MAQASSGITAIPTTDANPVTLIAGSLSVRNVVVTNTTAAACFFSLDDGVSWKYLGASRETERLNTTISSVQVKRATATDVTVYADVW